MTGMILTGILIVASIIIGLLGLSVYMLRPETGKHVLLPPLTIR